MKRLHDREPTRVVSSQTVERQRATEEVQTVANHQQLAIGFGDRPLERSLEFCDGNGIEGRKDDVKVRKWAYVRKMTIEMCPVF